MIKVRPIQLVRQGGLPFAVLSGLHPAQAPHSLESWQKALSENYEYLQHCSYDPVLLQGISLSSHSLMDRLPGLRDRPATQFHQTAAQAARTLCQYLARTAAKTSPFSALTTVGLVKHQIAQSPYAGTRVIPSFQLLQLFRDELQPYTFWVLNGSLIRNGQEYLWVARHPEHGEQLHKMQHSEILEWLEQTFLESEHPINAITCIRQLAAVTESSEADAKAFLLKLAEAGWMLPAWPVEQKTALWPTMLSRETWAPLPLLQLTQDKALEFPEESAEERVKVLQNLHTSWAAFSGAEHIPSPEKMLNEDVFVRPEIPARWQDALPGIIEQTEDCLQTVLPYYQWPARDLVIKSLEGKGTLPLVQAYSLCAAALNTIQQPSPIVPELPITLEQAKEWIGKPSILLEEFFKTLSPSNAAPLSNLGPSQGCFLQFWPNRINERFSAYVGATFAGYGKHMARYLSEYDETLAAEVMLENESMASSSGARWIELTDASLHSTEFRTPLLEGELLLPGAWRLYPPDLSMFPADLYATVKEDQLVLSDASGQRILPFDQGLIAPPARSPFFRFLTLFGYWHPNISAFTEAMEEYLLKPQVKEGIMYLPELRWTEDLVLARRAVYLHQSLLPVQEKGETHADFYTRIHSWKRQLGLSEHLFFTIAPRLPFYEDTPGPQKQDDYKPHYLDLNSPVSVDLFGRMMKRVTGYCKLESMLPSPEQMAGSHVQEWLVEWDRTSA